ncbi:hypothetical protein [Nonlabens antarcticus]|uniref:hypothetical protein n=1 Tax=Nonlabens antarcticus TaxID=392714 RepID=UPI001891463B|nr:hypothetical protein [Nonlabens antarcticus]
MKAYYTFLFIFLFSFTITAQVGINTFKLSPGSALQIDSTTGGLVPPRMNTEEMENIPTPLTGSLIYNSDTGSLWSYRITRWVNLAQIDIPSIVLNATYETGNNLINTQTNTYYNFPLDATDAITDVDPVFFKVTKPGEITIKQDGIYLITASFSIDNFPGGSHKYIIGLFIDGVAAKDLRGYLSRGNVTFPLPDGVDSTTPADNQWGTSGVITYPVMKDQKISLRYVINNNLVKLDAKIMNIAITKLQ